jgi:glycosyltransferase involved in cell wall biosynthesis
MKGGCGLGKYPLVSVVTPSYNQGQFIEETIESVLCQDYPHIEHIVIDGGSTDNTLDILKKYSGKIKWVSEKDEGQSDAVNKGFKMAQGEILGWVNSDDIYLPGAVGKVVDYFNANPEMKVVHGRGYYTGEDGSIIRPYFSDPDVKKSLSEAFNICQPAMFINRQVIDKVGSIDKSLHYCMDYDLVIRISREYDIGFLDEYLANSRLYRGNKSSSYQDMHNEVAAAQRKYFGKISFNQIFGYSNELLKSKVTWKEYPIERAGIMINIMAVMFSLYKFAQWNRKLPIIDFFRWLDMKVRLKAR